MMETQVPQKLENCHGFRNFYESSKTLKPKNCILHIFWSAIAPAPTATCHLQAGRFELWRDCKHGFTWTYHLRLMQVRPLTWSYCKGFRRCPFTFYFVAGSKSLPTNNICFVFLTFFFQSDWLKALRGWAVGKPCVSASCRHIGSLQTSPELTCAQSFWLGNIIGERFYLDDRDLAIVHG